MYSPTRLENTDHSKTFWRDNLQSLPSLHFYGPNDPQRGRIEQYIDDIFWKNYEARINGFHPLLFSLERHQQPVSVLGLGHASSGKLFSETYLDAPVEHYITGLFGQNAVRSKIMELGNLAGSEPRQSAQIYLLIVAAMHKAGIRYLLFTANRFVRASIKRSGFTPKTVCIAEQSRLGDQANQWGSYYAGTPQVMIADLQLTMQQALAQPAMVERLNHYQHDIATMADAITAAH